MGTTMGAISRIYAENREPLLRLFRLLRPYLKTLGLAALSMVGFAAFTALIAYLIKPVMDDIFFHRDMARLTLIPFGILAVFFLKGLCQWGSDYFLQVVGLSVVADLRSALFRHLTLLPLSFFDKQAGGELISRITNDVQEIQEAVSRAVTSLVRDVFTVVGLTVVIFYQNWRLALIALVVLPIAFYPLFVFGRLLRRLAHKSQHSMAKLASILHETFRGMRVVKAFCREEYEAEKFAMQNGEFYRYATRFAWIDALASPLMEFIGAIGIAAIMGYGGYQVILGKATPGGFFSFLGAIIMLYRPIKGLSRMNTYIQKGMASLERVYRILEEPNPVVRDSRATYPRRLRGEVLFRDVSFSYDGETPALRHINCHIMPGEVIALVGPSGSGKSTLVSLIPRFYEVTEGSILIDGVSIREISLSSLRRQIAIVTQQNFLFNDTVWNNIAYGKDGATEAEVVHAAHLAYADEFIRQLPDGFQTVVGEHGVLLSGGQQQRICIARAILKDAPILIMDEATSSLDSESEQEVQKALENLMAGRTTFIVAHRLSTVRRATRIFVMSGGRIVEEGSHEVLLARKGMYHRLYKLQHGQVAREEEQRRGVV